MDDAWDDDAEVDGQLVLADHLDIIHLHNRALPLDEEPTSGGEPAEDGADDWDVELKVLGQVRAIGTKEPLSPTELHLAIYLAFNRSGENADTIATMLWPNGINPRTLTNAMASLRRKLGTGADGEPLFPLGRDNQYTYSLSDRVVTDWDRFVALVDRAGRCDDEDDEADLLDQALELIDGPPFRAAAGYSWAYSDGTATLICDTVRAAAIRASRIHLIHGDDPRAAASTPQGAQVLLDDEFGCRVAPCRRSHKTQADGSGSHRHRESESVRAAGSRPTLAPWHRPRWHHIVIPATKKRSRLSKSTTRRLGLRPLEGFLVHMHIAWLTCCMPASRRLAPITGIGCPTVDTTRWTASRRPGT